MNCNEGLGWGGGTTLSVHLDNSYVTCVCHQRAPTSADEWFIKGHVMCCHVYVAMRIKDNCISVERVRHRLSLEGFCLSLYSMHVLNWAQIFY